MEREKFHGRVKGAARRCERPGCVERGEFRAPGHRGSGFDGPGSYRWFCLTHVREFNAGYDWFAGMTREEIEDAQLPHTRWADASRAFRPTAGVDEPPRWSDFHDPLDAISARFRSGVERARTDGRPLTPEDRRALKQMGLDERAVRKTLRARYTELLHRYHPDRNGGDRHHEKKLQAVVEAYQLLRASPAFKQDTP
jgi:hypothetical protein